MIHKEKSGRKVVIAITAASYSGNKGAAAMLKSSIEQLYDKYGNKLQINLMSVWPREDERLIPWKFVNVVSAEAPKQVFAAFPLAILYRLFRRFSPLKNILLKNEILNAYSNTDLVLDEAGVSFVDSRGLVMNTYAFINMAIPLLMEIPVVKYSQAMGSFHNPLNRMEAKWILPKIKLICARGGKTKKYLEGIHVVDNVRMCADGAFCMKEDEFDTSFQNRYYQDDFWSFNNIVGISPSTVVDRKCKKKGIDYLGNISKLISFLISKDFNVFIFANSARRGSNQSRNNDLLLCEKLFSEYNSSEQVRFYKEEFRPEELCHFIGQCRFVVASRFHAMIFALKKKVPVFLIGWSHKYQEILDYFELGRYAIDFSEFSSDSLIEGFLNVVENEMEIQRCIDLHYDEVIQSSYQNVVCVEEILDEILNNKTFS